MKKAKNEKMTLIILAWLIAIALVYVAFLKIHLVLNTK
ncbi:hypothetical protein H4V97_003149 [Flavobacterium sp. CG_23.5]|nr:hypothetical protein [Flavobacterium sp. CG_23.5]